MLLQNSFFKQKNIIYNTTSFVFVVLCLLFYSCESKHNAVYDLLIFRTEIKNHSSEYTQSDWENAFEEYSDICQRLDDMPLSHEERVEIQKIKGEIAGYAATVAAQKTSDRIRAISEEINSFANGFSNTFQIPHD